MHLVLNETSFSAVRLAVTSSAWKVGDNGQGATLELAAEADLDLEPEFGTAAVFRIRDSTLDYLFLTNTIADWIVTFQDPSPTESEFLILFVYDVLDLPLEVRLGVSTDEGYVGSTDRGAAQVIASSSISEFHEIRTSAEPTALPTTPAPWETRLTSTAVEKGLHIATASVTGPANVGRRMTWEVTLDGSATREARLMVSPLDQFSARAVLFGASFEEALIIENATGEGGSELLVRSMTVDFRPADHGLDFSSEIGALGGQPLPDPSRRTATSDIRRT